MCHHILGLSVAIPPAKVQHRQCSIAWVVRFRTGGASAGRSCSFTVHRSGAFRTPPCAIRGFGVETCRFANVPL
jgi:hypothetical protein